MARKRTTSTTLEKFRLNQGWEMAALAEAVGTSPNTLWRLEKGQAISRATVARYLTLLEFDLNRLEAGEQVQNGRKLEVQIIDHGPLIQIL